uniref:Transposase n=1 Tax=Peronospora matthiolae TaxID=2874970 RepID=A0AAV1VFC4_9STRA
MAEYPSRIQKTRRDTGHSVLKTAATAIDHNVQNAVKKKTRGTTSFRSVKRHLRNRATSGWSTQGDAHDVLQEVHAEQQGAVDAVDIHLADDGIVRAIGVGTLSCRWKTPQGG